MTIARLGVSAVFVLFAVSCEPEVKPIEPAKPAAPSEPAAKTPSTPPPAAAPSVAATPSTPVTTPEPATAPTTVSNDALAIVDGVAIPVTAFRAVYDLKVAKYTQRGREVPASADVRYRRSIFDRLVHHELLRQAADKLDLHPDPAELTLRVEQSKSGISDWTTHLERRGETEQSLRAMYESEVRERMILDKRGLLTVTAADIDAEFAASKNTQPRATVEPEIRQRLAARKLLEGRRRLKDELLAAAKITDNRVPTIGPEPAGAGEAASADDDESD